jgi:hypothetical protein
MSTRMLGVHLLQTVPAPVASPMSLTLPAPAPIAVTIVLLVTASHKQTHTVGNGSECCPS